VVARCAPLRLADQLRVPSRTRRRSLRRDVYFFFFDLRFAVLRAVFFAADFVFDFAFFAILPS
jgi:hypothetical protein